GTTGMGTARVDRMGTPRRDGERGGTMGGLRRLLTGAVILAVAAILVPQHGDSMPDPVTHPEWARMMLRGLGLGDALAYADPPPRAFAILSWRQSEWLHAPDFIAGSEHGVALEPGSPALLRAFAALGE